MPARLGPCKSWIYGPRLLDNVTIAAVPSNCTHVLVRALYGLERETQSVNDLEAQQSREARSRRTSLDQQAAEKSSDHVHVRGCGPMGAAAAAQHPPPTPGQAGMCTRLG
jgi:hypothetical protein